MTTFSELITSVASDLHQAGFIKDADELRHLANLSLDQTLLADTRKDALKQIEMRCDVKWLGDFYLPHLSQKDWWGKLERFGRSTKKHVRFIGQFQGQHKDEETGLHYNRQRHYEPDGARYITVDPIGLLGGMVMKEMEFNMSPRKG